jgi:hypothetical protein
MTATEQFLHFIGVATCVLGALRVLLPFMVSIYYETMYAHLQGRRYTLVGEAQKIVHPQEEEAR